MEEICPVCGTNRIEGMDCQECGWEFIEESDREYQQRFQECKEFIESQKGSELADVKDAQSVESDNSDEIEDLIEKSETESGDAAVDEEKKEDVSAVPAITENEYIEETQENDEGIQEEEEKNQVVDREELEELLNQNTERIIDEFSKKIIYDEFKEKQIDRLHSELQEYKRDLISKTNMPLFNGLIFMFDDMDKLLGKLQKESEELTKERMIKILKGIQEDIEILLEENGVTAFENVDNVFNPKRQQVAQKIETSEKEVVGQVVEQIRPGFEQGDKLIRKERVSVYVYAHKEENIGQDENSLDNADLDTNDVANKEEESEK